MESHDQVNILMVDDQPAKLLSYDAILGDLGENLLKAGSAKEALDLLLKHDVALVLLDVNMPDMSGFELADIIHQHPRFQKTAIIFISAVHLTDMDRLQGYERGAVDYISVPVVPALLRAKVSVFTELHRKTRQLEELNRELETRVTERTKELQQSADLLNLATEAVSVRDSEGRLEFWNAGAEALYGWKREEVIGKKIHEVLRTKFPIPLKDIEAALTNSGQWGGNLVQVTRDGREITVACRKALQLDNGGTPRAVLEIGRDITSQLQTEAALRKSERFAAMGRVAGIIAHEINNPLEAITNAFFLLRDHPSLDEQGRRYAQIADQELSRVARITRQTLGFYRESQQSVSFKVVSVLDDVLELQERTLQMNGIILEKKYRSDGEIMGFPAEFKQVFLNLLSNAIQSMPDGGRLRVGVYRGQDGKTKRRGVRVSFCDTGSGVQPEDAKHLFEPFFSTKAEKGTGLGLWISKGIITKYDGTIRFRSIRRSGDYATCFSVFIPALAPPRESKTKTSKRKPKEAIRSY